MEKSGIKHNFKKDSRYYDFVYFRTPEAPHFKLVQSEMQTVAAGNCGHRIELFCKFDRG